MVSAVIVYGRTAKAAASRGFVNTLDARIRIAQVLRETLVQNVPKERLHRLFMDRLSELDQDLNYPSRITDQSLNAVWNFCDYYFDALGHGFADCGGIPITEATQKLNEVISVLESGEEVKDPEVLRFYHKPEEWRLQNKFPWLSRS